MRVAVCVLGLVVATIASPAYAAPTAADTKKALELVNTGADHYAAGRFDDAREAFAKAYALSPTFRVRENLAAAEMKAGRSADAARHYHENLSDPTATDAAQKNARKWLAKIEPLVARAEIAAMGTVPIFLDGASSPIDYGPLIYLMPGTHQFHAEGRLDKTIAVAAGNQVNIDLPLLPVAKSEPPPPPAVTEPSHVTPSEVPKTESKPDKSNPAATVAIVGGIATAVVGVTFIVASVETGQTYQNALTIHNALPTGACPSSSTCQSLLNAENRHDAWITPSYILGGATAALAVGTGVATYFALRSSGSEHPRDARLTPLLGPGFAGLHFSTSF